MEEIPIDQIDLYREEAMTLAIEYGPKLIGAIIVLILGLWLIKGIANGVNRFMKQRELDESLRPFLRTLINITLKVLLVISVMSMIGIAMTSFIAILGAAGLAIGMALSGTLQNFAGGVMILVLKPYKVGDVLEAQGYLGIVSEIQIFNTIMKTFDNKTIIIPNGKLSNESMTNYSTEPIRRVEWTFGIAYGDSSDKAKEVIMRLIKEDERVLEDPAPMVAVKELADSSVNFVARAWVKSEDLWNVHFDMNEKVYNTFGSEGLNIPFPQVDVHLDK